jgi:Ca-activated chloride channel family protein
MGRIRRAALARRHTLLSASLALLAAASLLPAQQEPLFRTEVRLVRLLTTVRNLDGKLVGGLDKSDFTIYDNSVKQEIAVFERTTAQPLSIALLMDKSGSIAKDLKIALDSVKRFLQTLFREGNRLDEVSLYSFNWQVEQHIGFTRNIPEIEKRVQAIKAEAGTSLYDAIHFGARALEGRPGRHVILIVTDGGDTTSALKYHDALEAAHRADAPIYSILLMPITNDAGRNIGGENALTTLAQSTGGKVFTPTLGQELDRALSDILLDLRTQYLIAYYPKNIPPANERFHRIRVELSRPDLRAVTRSGYYGDTQPNR